MNPISAFALILLVLLIVFFLINTDPVTVDFLLSEQDVSLALVIIIATMIGFVLGLIVPRLFRREVEHAEIKGNKARLADETDNPDPNL